MTEGTTSQDVTEANADAETEATRKWYETPAGRGAATMVSIGFLGIVVAAMLLLTQRAHDAESATEATDSAPATATATETPSETAAPSSAPTSKPTTTAAERPTTVSPSPTPTSRAPAAPAPTPRAVVPPPAAPTTVPTTPAEATTEESEPEMPELNVTRGPIEMSPHRGDTE